MQLTEVTTLDRKSGKAEGSAVRHSGAPRLPFYNHFPLCHPEDSDSCTRPLPLGIGATAALRDPSEASPWVSTRTASRLRSSHLLQA
jgi:hypothetical protein